MDGLVTKAGGWLGLALLVPKLVAVAVGFQLTYVLRKSVVFGDTQEALR